MPEDLTGLLQPTPAALDTSKLAQPRTARLSRHQGLWASVPLEELTDRRHDETYSARTRLLLFLRIKSRRGQRTWRPTNEDAAEIGLDRPQKLRCLRYLELGGYVSVDRRGKQVPVVTVMLSRNNGALSGDNSALSGSNGSLSGYNTG
jgi:hypothetical protein